MLVISVENLGQRQLVGVIVAGGMNKGRDWQTGSLFRGWGEPGTGTGGTGVRHPETQGHVQKGAHTLGRVWCIRSRFYSGFFPASPYMVWLPSWLGIGILKKSTVLNHVLIHTH